MRRRYARQSLLVVLPVHVFVSNEGHDASFLNVRVELAGSDQDAKTVLASSTDKKFIFDAETGTISKQLVDVTEGWCVHTTTLRDSAA